MMREDIERERNRSWFGNPTKYTCSNCGKNINETVRAGHNSGFINGARWGIKSTTQFSPHVAKMIELVTWLAVQDDTFKDRMIELMFDPDYSAALKKIVLGELVDPHTHNESKSYHIESVGDVELSPEDHAKEQQHIKQAERDFSDITPQIQYWSEQP